MKNFHQLEHEGLTWLNITSQNEKEVRELQKKFNFLDQDIGECLPPFQRPKIVKRSDYYFIILHFPVFDRATRRLGFTEVDFFLNRHLLVTVHSNKLLTIENFFNQCKKDPSERAAYFKGTAIHLCFELLSRLLEAIFPILMHINEDMTLVDRKLFSAVPGAQMAEEVLRLKTNVVTFRRSMQGHRTVLDRLVLSAGRELELYNYQTYINSLKEFTNEIWHMLESQKESINALHETNESLINLRTTDVMKTLTVISVITFPLTLAAALFAIHAPGNPFVNTPGGFWIVCAILFGGGIGTVIFFKRRGWM